eukprot:TRINITY_DN9849_c0_g1_i1.p1 TRINITY_DN9849_c0_g1~~TRINITY_DN9849_c0_g1_i1.p1  ORF type:complete len:5765 (-),score=1054.79 TRINITY_DN9849_c0_g1_i1:19-14961(-)
MQTCLDDCLPESTSPAPPSPTPDLESSTTTGPFDAESTTEKEADVSDSTDDLQENVTNESDSDDAFRVILNLTNTSTTTTVSTATVTSTTVTTSSTSLTTSTTSSSTTTSKTTTSITTTTSTTLTTSSSSSTSTITKTTSTSSTATSTTSSSLTSSTTTETSSSTTLTSSTSTTTSSTTSTSSSTSSTSSSTTSTSSSTTTATKTSTSSTTTSSTTSSTSSTSTTSTSSTSTTSSSTSTSSTSSTTSTTNTSTTTSTTSTSSTTTYTSTTSTTASSSSTTSISSSSTTSSSTTLSTTSGTNTTTTTSSTSTTSTTYTATRTSTTTRSSTTTTYTYGPNETSTTETSTTKTTTYISFTSTSVTSVTVTSSSTSVTSSATSSSTVSTSLTTRTTSMTTNTASTVTNTVTSTTSTSTTNITAETEEVRVNVTLSDLEFCLAACKAALLRALRRGNASENLTENMTSQLAANCLIECTSNGTAALFNETEEAPPEAADAGGDVEVPAVYCNVLDVSILRVPQCPLPGGFHSISVQPTPAGFAEKANLKMADFQIHQPIVVETMDPFGSSFSGGQVITMTGVGFPSETENVHMHLRGIGDAEILSSSHEQITWVSPYVDRNTFETLWNTSDSGFTNSHNGKLTLPVDLRIIVGEIFPALVAKFSRCSSFGNGDADVTLHGLTFEGCSQSCMRAYTSSRCTAFSYGHSGAFRGVCHLSSDRYGCGSPRPDINFDAYELLDGSSNGTLACWPETTTTTTTQATITSTTMTATSTTVTSSTVSSTTTFTGNITETRTVTSTTSATSSTSTSSTSTTSISNTSTTTSISNTSTSVTSSSTSATITTSTATTTSNTSTTTSSTTTYLNITTTNTTTSSKTTTSSTATSRTSTSSTATSATLTSTSATLTTTSTTTGTTSWDPKSYSFLVEEPIPQVNTISPRNGSAGTSMTISGTEFGLAAGEVFFVEPDAQKVTSENSARCKLLHWGEEHIECEVQDLPAGIYQVRVRVPLLGDAVAPEVFRSILALGAVNGTAPAAPSPTRGGMQGGQVLSIIGQGFGGETSISLCGQACEVLSASYNEVFFLTPTLLTSAAVTMAEASAQLLQAHLPPASRDASPRAAALGPAAQAATASAFPYDALEVSRAFDGHLDETVELREPPSDEEGHSEPCRIGIDAGDGKLFALTRLAYYVPPEVDLRALLVGSQFQVGNFSVLEGNYTPVAPLVLVEVEEEKLNDSNCTNESNDSNCTNTTEEEQEEPLNITKEPEEDDTGPWKTFWQIEEQPEVGWNFVQLPRPLYAERIRLLGTQDAGSRSCGIREIEAFGHLLKATDEGCALEVAVLPTEMGTAAADVVSEAPLGYLASQLHGATIARRGQVEMQPGGSLVLKLVVSSEVTTRPLVQVEAAAPLPKKQRKMLRSLYSFAITLKLFGARGAQELPPVDLEITSDGAEAMIWSDVVELPTLQPGLWEVHLSSSYSNSLHLGTLKSLTPGVELLATHRPSPSSLDAGEAAEGAPDFEPFLELTPWIEKLEPGSGPLDGGTKIVLTGSAFLCNSTASMEDLIVEVSGAPCSVTAAHENEIQCVSGPAPRASDGGPAIAPNFTAGARVFIEGCGYSMASARATFAYVSRWSEPNSWAYEEPPLPAPELFIPRSQNLLLDVSTAPFGLLRLEGQLEFDAEAGEELELQAERLWIRGGELLVDRRTSPRYLGSLRPKAGEAFLYDAEKRQQRRLSEVAGRPLNTSLILAHAEAPVVQRDPMRAPGVAKYQVTVSDRSDSTSSFPESKGKLRIHGGSDVQRPKSSRLAVSAEVGSSELRLASAIDVQAGEMVLVAGGSTETFEEHVVAGVEEDGKTLLLEGSLRASREGGVHSFFGEAVDGSPLLGEADISAVVAVMSRSTVLRGEEGKGLRISCRSAGLCTLDDVLLTACGASFPGAPSEACLELRSLPGAPEGEDMAVFKNSAVLHAEGSALRMESTSEGHTAVADGNLILRPYGSGLAMSTRGPGATSKLDTLTVRKNTVVAARMAAFGLPDDLRPSAFEMHTGLAALETNFASEAEIGFRFDPRDDPGFYSRSPQNLELQSSTWPLAAFDGNAAQGCSRALYVPGELRVGASKVMSNFTAFNSSFALHVKACDRCRMVDSSWLQSTFGLYDEDSSPVIGDSPWIRNLLAVGTLLKSSVPEVSQPPQLILSANEGWQIDKVVFYNFGRSHLMNGGFRTAVISTSELHFHQSVSHIYTAAPAGWGIFSDLDGTLTGTPGGSMTGDRGYNHHSSCTSIGSTEFKDYRIACNSQVLIRAMKVTAPEPLDLVGRTMQVRSIYGHGTVNYSEATGGWFFTVIAAKDHGDFRWPLTRWSEEGPTPVEWRKLPFWYDVSIDSDLDWRRLRISFGSPGQMTPTEWVGLNFAYTQDPVRWFEAFGQEGSCFWPYFDWLKAGGYDLWPDYGVTHTSTTSSTSTSSSTSSTTKTSTSISVTFTTTTTNLTLNTTTITSTWYGNSTTTVTVSTSTATSTSTTASNTSTTTSSASVTSTTTNTATSSSTTKTRTSTSTTFLGITTTSVTKTTRTSTTTTITTTTTIPIAAPLRRLTRFPEPTDGCAAMSFLFEICERPNGLSAGPCLPDGPVVGWANWTEMVNATLFANGTLTVMMANSEQGDYTNPMVVDLVNHGCGDGGCIYQEVARTVMGPSRNWTDPDAWPSGEVPQNVDVIATIPPFYHIVYDNATAVGKVGELRVYGKLSFAPVEGLKLLVKAIQVFPEGILEVGTAEAPHPVNAMISFWGVALDSFPTFISMNVEWGKKLIGVYEGTISLHGRAYSKAWARLAKTVLPGDDELMLRTDISDWPLGAEVAISSTEYPGQDGGPDSETRTLREVRWEWPNTYLVLDRPLEHRHYAGALSTGEQGGRVETSSVVALLSRSLVITTEEALNGSTMFPDPERGVAKGGHGGNWYGVHTIIAGRSFASMSWVQFDKAGKDGLKWFNRFPALKFFQPEGYTRQLPTPFLEALSFTGCQVGGIAIVGAWDLLAFGNIFNGTYGPAIEAGMAMGEVRLGLNLAIGNLRPPLWNQATLPYEPSAAFQIQNKPLLLSGNVVAGAADIGFLIRPRTCSEAVPEGELDNEAHGCLVGFMILRSCPVAGGGPDACPGDLDCVHVRHLKAWKNSHIGVFFLDQPAHMEMSNIFVADNHIGITGTFHRLMGDMLHSFILHTSRVYGTTAASTCDASVECLAVGPGETYAETCQSTAGPEFRRIGVMLPVITNRGKSCEDGPTLQLCPSAVIPDRNCALPWEKRYGIRGSRQSHFYLENITFSGFLEEDCDKRSVAISYNPTARDWNPSAEVRGLEWADSALYFNNVENFSETNFSNASNASNSSNSSQISHTFYSIVVSNSSGPVVNSRFLWEPWDGQDLRGETKCGPVGPMSLSEMLLLGDDVSTRPVCAGLQQTWLTDADGSLLGIGRSSVILPPGSLLPSMCDTESPDFFGFTRLASAIPEQLMFVPNLSNVSNRSNMSDEPFPILSCERNLSTNQSECTKWPRTLDGGPIACTAFVPRLFNWQSLDPDCCGFYRRDLGLLRVTRLYDGAYEDTHFMYDDADCTRGMEYGQSSFPVRMEIGNYYQLHFTKTSRMPRLSRLHLFSPNVFEEIRIQMPLGRMRRPQIFVFGTDFGMLQRTGPPETGDSHGAFYLDRDELVFHMMMRGMPGGLQGQGAVLLRLLEVIFIELVVFMPLADFKEIAFVADVSKSMNVSSDRVQIVTVASAGLQWMPGDSGRRLETGRELAMMETVRIKIEVSEDPPPLSPEVLGDSPLESEGSSSSFFEGSPEVPPAEADSIIAIQALAANIEAQIESGTFNFSYPISSYGITNIPTIPETTIQRLSCGVDAQGNQVCVCDPGWYGPACTSKCNCTGVGIAACDEGPTGNGTCICKTGFIGAKCDACDRYYYTWETRCSIYCHPDDRCSGHGECTTDPTTHEINGCKCSKEWVGDSCDMCADNYYPALNCSVFCDKWTTCSGNGECGNNGKCNCFTGRLGENCDRCAQEYYPAGICSTRCYAGNCKTGSCDDQGHCQCRPDWYGQTCSLRCQRCDPVGSWGCNDGRLGDGQCMCKPGYDGKLCTDTVEYLITEWSPCDGTCGGYAGTRTRLARCYNMRSSFILPNERCAEALPVTEEACLTPMCHCSSPPFVKDSNMVFLGQKCPYVPNGEECELKCDYGFQVTGVYKCETSRYIETPICLPFGENARVLKSLYSVVTMAGIDVTVVKNLTGWFDFISDPLREALAESIGAGSMNKVRWEHVRLQQMREVILPPATATRLLSGLTDSDEDEGSHSAAVRLLQGDVVSIEVPLFIAGPDDAGLTMAEAMLTYYSNDASVVKQGLEQKLKALCHEVMPSLRAVRCTSPAEFWISRPIRTKMNLPPLAAPPPPPNTTTLPPPAPPPPPPSGMSTVAVIFMILGIVAVIAVCCFGFNRFREQQRARKEREEMMAFMKEGKAGRQSILAGGHRKALKGTLLGSEPETWFEALTDKAGKPLTGQQEKLKLLDGSIFSGQFLDGEPDGQGRMEWPGGRTYVGQWLRGQPDGHGVMFSVAPPGLESETWIYSGQFQSGMRSGLGRAEWPALGGWYDGDWEYGVQHGIGESGEGATESFNGKPEIWCMFYGEQQDMISNGYPVPDEDQDLMVAVLQARSQTPAELDEVELILARYGFAVGNPHVWVYRHQHAFLVTRVEEGGPLDAWNKAQIWSDGPDASIVKPNSTIWRVNGICGDIAKMTEALLSPTTKELEIEVWSPTYTRLESMRSNLYLRAGWSIEPDDNIQEGGFRFKRKSPKTKERELLRPWMMPPPEPALPPGPGGSMDSDAPGPAEPSPPSEAKRKNSRPGLPCLLRLPEVPGPPSTLVASVVPPPIGSPPPTRSRGQQQPQQPQQSRRQSAQLTLPAVPPAPNRDGNARRLSWPKAPVPGESSRRASADSTALRPSRSRVVEEAVTPPMSPRGSGDLPPPPALKSEDLLPGQAQ